MEIKRIMIGANQGLIAENKVAIEANTVAIDLNKNEI